MCGGTIEPCVACGVDINLVDVHAYDYCTTPGCNKPVCNAACRTAHFDEPHLGDVPFPSMPAIAIDLTPRVTPELERLGVKKLYWPTTF